MIVDEMKIKRYAQLINEYSKRDYMKLTRESGGRIKYPFIVPGKIYDMQLWDWDSWLTDIAVRQIMENNNIKDDCFKKYEFGCILNFIDYTDENGKMPILISSKNGDSLSSHGLNMHKPCIVQHIAFIIKQTNDIEWIAQHIDKLKLFLGNYSKYQKNEETGLYFWLDDFAVGVDNDPAVFYRPQRSCASIFLNCMMYKELRAMEYICSLVGGDSSKYREDADALKIAINEHLWDERNGFYYSADLNLMPIDKNTFLHSGMPRHWNSIIQKIDGWSGFMAMWSGVASAEKAKRMVSENLLNKKLFWGKHGVRTLSKAEKMYRVVQSSNPSCWLGPVWGIANYMCFKGLVDYGFAKEAKELAEKTILLFGMDIEDNGEMHECYDADTGEGFNVGFQSWNLLVNNMITWLYSKSFITEF